MLHDVFLSFSFADGARARALHGGLSRDLGCFFAPVDLPEARQREARFQYADLLTDSLTRSGHFVGLLSPRYLQSAWCRLEMQGFANLRRRDRTRGLWLFELEPCADAVPAALRGLVFGGDEAALCAAVRDAVQGGAHPRRDDDLDRPPSCLPGLPLRSLYRPPRRAPWGLEAQSRGTPGAPPYGVYESLVRETMVQLLRRGRWGITAPADDPPIELEVPIDGLDPRLKRLSRYAREDAEHLLGRNVDPFHLDRRCSELCATLMFAFGAGGETPEGLCTMADCRSHMGAASCREALAIAARAVAAGADPAGYREIRARAHVLLGDFALAIAVLDTPVNAAEHRLRAAACALAGEAAAAAQAAAAARALDPGFNLADERLNTRLEIDADIERWLAGLAKAGFV